MFEDTAESCRVSPVTTLPVPVSHPELATTQVLRVTMPRQRLTPLRGLPRGGL